MIGVTLYYDGEPSHFADRGEAEAHAVDRALHGDGLPDDAVELLPDDVRRINVWIGQSIDRAMHDGEIERRHLSAQRAYV